MTDKREDDRDFGRRQDISGTATWFWLVVLAGITACMWYYHCAGC